MILRQRIDNVSPYHKRHLSTPSVHERYIRATMYTVFYIITFIHSTFDFTFVILYCSSSVVNVFKFQAFYVLFIDLVWL